MSGQIARGVTKARRPRSRSPLASHRVGEPAAEEKSFVACQPRNGSRDFLELAARAHPDHALRIAEFRIQIARRTQTAAIVRGYLFPAHPPSSRQSTRIGTWCASAWRQPVTAATHRQRTALARMPAIDRERIRNVRFRKQFVRATRIIDTANMISMGVF